MRFPTLHQWLGEKPVSVCSFCARALFAGEEVWRCNGEIACNACFLPFADEQLAAFHSILGEEDRI